MPLARCPFVLQTKKSSPPFARNSQVEGNTGRLLKLEICKEENECVMKKQKVNRIKIIMVRLTTDEYEQLHKKYKSTVCRKLSDYLRNVLLQGKVTVLTRNQSLDDFMAEMIALRKELNGIGNNFNQAVHKLHLLDRIPEFRTWILQSDREKKMLLKMIEEIKTRINQFAERW